MPAFFNLARYQHGNFSPMLTTKRQILTDRMVAIDKLLSIGARSARFVGSSRKHRIISASALFLALCAFGAAGVAPMAPDAADLPVQSIVEELALPTLAEQVAGLTPSAQTFINEERVRPGDTLATLTQRLGINDDDAIAFIKTDPMARGMLQLKTGRRVQAQTSTDGQLLWMTAADNDSRDNAPVRNLAIKRDGDSFKASLDAAALEKRMEMRSGEIRSSLFAATDVAQIPDAIASQIVDMFSTNIDFRTDLRRGDRFNVIYETFWQDGEYVRSGRILAAEFRNGGSTYQTVWYEEPGKAGGYFGFDGKSLKKAFLKSPRSSDLGTLAPAQGRRLRRRRRHADPGVGRWRGGILGHAEWLRQHRGHQALVELLHCLCAHEPLRQRAAKGPESQPGRRDWLCRLNRLVHRAAPAL
jgi:murein DD-endopeptidase MepM/ murein hydrolase activator NlpD